MKDDPAGFYARLGVDAAATPEAIAAAFRRKARVLHPDVVGTGDTSAFLRMKEAYDVLSDPQRRAAYDRTARAAVAAAPATPEPATRGPRLGDLPVPLWATLGGVFCLAVVMAVHQLSRPPRRPPGMAMPPAVTVAPAPLPPRQPAPAPAVVAAAGGAPTHYIVPAGGDPVLWRQDRGPDSYVPQGRLPPFTSVQALRLVPQHGLVEIRLANGATGFVDAARLVPGDGTAARRAYCMYNAGKTPVNGEVLQRRAQGPVRLQIANHGAEPAVVKLRDASGVTAATVFVEAGASAVVAGLPDGTYRPEFAVGELWSRACHVFTAGMRAQRFAGYTPLLALSPLVIPPDLSAAPPPVDIPDTDFERE